MRSIAEYIVSVSAAAFLCGILNSMMVKGSAREVMKLVTGLFLAFCVIRPVMDLKLPDPGELTASIREEAADAAEEGERIAMDSMAAGISEQLETYILDRASSLGMNLDVQVFLKEDESFLPQSVVLTGEAAPLKRRELIREITEALGIPEEDIEWNSEN